VDRVRALLEDAIARRVFPAAVAEVGDSRGELCREVLGSLTFDTGAVRTAAHTIFDLASLTKPLATTLAVLQLAGDARLALDQPVGRWIRDWRGADRESVTLKDLLEHASGLPARLVDKPPASRREFEHEIGVMRLEFAPRTQAVYSDLGFILLGFVAADCGRAPLEDQFSAIVAPVLDKSGMARQDLAFGVVPSERHRAAPTWPMDADIRRGRFLAGEVHDDYASLLGGVAGHAGLFGTIGGVGALARAVLTAARRDSARGAWLPHAVRALGTEATTKSTVPGSSRALGWDTMLPDSSCGTQMSASAFGHTGFTGTSLWIDPPRDRYFALLTNRVCGGAGVAEMQNVRRAFHDLATS
jgi:CubicO group peptidase (beta-lactamase class C family)